MQETSDMIRSGKVKESNYSLNPRNGSILHFTDEEYEKLISANK